MLVYLAWTAPLASYRKLNFAKFTVLYEIEAKLPLQPFKREQEVYKSTDRRPLSRVERGVPWSFIVLYIVMMAYALWAP